MSVGRTTKIRGKIHGFCQPCGSPVLGDYIVDRIAVIIRDSLWLSNINQEPADVAYWSPSDGTGTDLDLARPNTSVNALKPVRGDVYRVSSERFH